MSVSTWRFRPSPVDGGRTGGDQAAMNFEHDLETFVREVLQNSLDARRPEGATVTVELAIHEVGGVAKAALLDAARWSELREHVRAARRLAPSFAAPLPRIDDPDRPLLALSIHDGPALGLSGPERGEGRFASFARNKLFSDKESGSAGGSYGLGKSVLWAFSGISTVFVHSEPVVAKAGDPRSRFLGIAQLPWHQVGGEEFDGPGWFGIGHGSGRASWSASFAAETALLDALRLRRPAEFGTGTSILIPDFQSDSEPAVLADELARAAAKWFWPAMGGSERALEVFVRNGQGRRRVEPAQHPELRPFLHLGGLSLHPAWSPRTTSGSEPLKLPAARETMADQAGFEMHPAQTVGDAFRIEALSLEDGHGELDKHMALVRGARMVVRYVKLQTDRPAWALVRAGTACSGSDPDRLVEQFLRYAEPPSHDDWSPHAPKLHDLYKQGYVGELKGLKKRLADRVAVLVRKQEGKEATQEIPAALRKVLAVSMGPSDADNPREGRFDYSVDRCELVQNDQGPEWRFSGWVQNTREGPWELQAEAWLDSDGEKVRVGIEDLRVDGLFTEPVERGLRIEGGGHLRFSGRCPLSALGGQAARAVFGLHLKPHAVRSDESAKAGGDA
jgi:hypothetical protein